MSIRVLPDHLINQICAGEVADRPATILKELIENALDAGATKIQIETEEGGKNKLVITDNGSGMTKEDLEKSILRHATSKIPDEDLFNICSFGFRGEALASIAAASRLKITTSNGPEGWQMTVASGKILEIKPIARTQGATIEVSDLFYAIPARLKFLRSTRAEQGAINEIIKRFAIGNPGVSFQINKISYDPTTLEKRAGKIIGADFIENSLSVFNDRDDYAIEGLVGKPTYYKHNSKELHLFVNGRFLKDKVLFSYIRQAYYDVMPYDRYPVVVLKIKVPENEIDVNVHPAKTEVRFRNPQALREIVVGSIKKELGKTSLERQDISTLKTANPGVQSLKEHAFEFQRPMPFAPSGTHTHSSQIKDEDIILHTDNPVSMFGEARFQLYNAYIISQSQDGWFLTDQHAAHERIVLEKLQTKEIVRQPLLMPEVFITEPDIVEKLIVEIQSFKESGFVIEKIDETSIAIKEIPAFLKYIPPIELFQKITAEMDEKGSSNAHKDLIHRIRGTIACHGSIRAGQSLSIPEMNALLKQIEETPRAMQCNHGRPSVIKLDRNMLDRFFERT
ncbi:MAG: DNA mismatch repair endonuclease MutL [Alphaproteobacteria bacterium]|nr:DNA mismatch repair endonuclease MutL [Alphaproteobacteria bacterium]MBN2779626.1 DNA mismatch repair endonuclease MutL [Alphaproteobacteria bacterium]